MEQAAGGDAMVVPRGARWGGGVSSTDPKLILELCQLGITYNAWSSNIQMVPCFWVCVLEF